MIDFDALRKEVAVKHGVLLGPDDPILVTVTLHDLVLGRYVEVLSAQNAGHAKALSAALAEQVEQSKALGGRIITEAADYVSTQVREAVTAAITEAGDRLRADLNAARQESAALAAEAGTARATAIGAALGAGLCAALAAAMAGVVLLR
jgi:hypothetical protein